MHGLLDCPCLLFDHRNDWFLCGYHIQRSYRTGKLHTGSSNLCNRSFAWKIYFSFFSRKILFYSASITVIFQIIITALELVMPDLLGALGIVLFLYPIGWYRIIIRLLVRIGSGGVLSYFLASLCPYLFIFFGKQTSD